MEKVHVRAGRWVREFTDADTAHVFVLQGPRVKES